MTNKGKMFLVHKTTGKRFLLAQHRGSGWYIDVLQFTDGHDGYIAGLRSFFNDCVVLHTCILKNWNEFQKNSQEFCIEFE